jgi:transposase
MPRVPHPELTAFLWDRDLDGTNNAAERALRPAVVMRKITGGSRSRRGAAAWAKVASLVRTARQQGRDLLTAIRAMLQAAWATDRPPSAVTER